MDNGEDDIIRSWHVNASPWTEAVRARGIASRRLVTDQAIVDAVHAVAPRRVLDIGCGEGWLARTLQRGGVDVYGIDVVPELVVAARCLGEGEFAVYSYADVAEGRLQRGPFDAVVCNFSLLGRESVDSLIAGVGAYLNDPGYLVVQTLHPVAACGDQPYIDGWRRGNWQGFGGDFRDPAPWFFRTFATWYAMLRRCGFEVTECREPTAPGACAPSSVIFVCRRSATVVNATATRI